MKMRPIELQSRFADLVSRVFSYENIKKRLLKVFVEGRSRQIMLSYPLQLLLYFKNADHADRPARRGRARVSQRLAPVHLRAFTARGTAYLFVPVLALVPPLQEPETPAVQLNSHTAFRGIRFFDEGAPDSYDGRGELLFAPRLDLSLPHNVRIESELQLRGDAVDASRNRILVRQAFLDLSFDDWDLRAGRQIIRRGRVDGLRPTDYFRRRDFTDFLQADEEPVDAVQADYYVAD